MERTLLPHVLAVLPLINEEGTEELRLVKHVSLQDLMAAPELSSPTMLQDAHSSLFSESSLDTVRD